MNKMNSLSKNALNAKKTENNDLSNNNLVDISLSNLDYCEYYQYLYVKDFADYLIQGIFSEAITKNKNKEENASISEQNNDTINIFNIDKIQKLFCFNSVEMFPFINNNIISLVDNKGEVNIINFKKIFKLITKLDFDVFDFYYTNSLKNENNNFDSNTFDYYLNSKIINLDNEDANVLNFLKDKQNKVDIGINNNATLNDNNNKTMKKLLTTNYDYGFNETNDYFDVVSLCLFIFDYYYNLNDGTLQNYLKIKSDNQYSKTQPYIYKNKKQQQYFNHTENNVNLNNTPNLEINRHIYIDKLNLNNQTNESKIMVVSILSGHNIIKPNSDFTSRPNCYFVLEFDDKNYTSDIVMNSSQPNFNEELEIKINSKEYVQKLNALLIYISVFSFVDENRSIFIGRCEIAPSKMFPFLNESNECEDFFHIIGEEGQVMGQLNIKFKFDSEVLGNLTQKRILGNNSFLMSNLNLTNEGGINKKNNNTISFSLNNVVENNSKNKFIMTGEFNENDPLHRKLAEAMNSVENLTQILQNKVENDNKGNIINNLNENKLNNNQYHNLSDIKSEENVNTNSNDLLGQHNYDDNFNDKNENQNNINNFNENNNDNNDYEENYEYNGEEEIQNDNEDENEEMENENFEENNLNNENQNENKNIDNNNINNNNNKNNNINNGNELNNKMTMTDYNLNNSQKLSVNDEDNDKASFYSDTKGNDNNKNNKMKYLKNYDKKLLNKIQKVMKNQK